MSEKNDNIKSLQSSQTGYLKCTNILLTLVNEKIKSFPFCTLNTTTVIITSDLLKIFIATRVSVSLSLYESHEKQPHVF